MLFKVVYAPEVYVDLQEAINFYNSKRKDFGSRFLKTVRIQISEIQSGPYLFQIRYSDVRCAPIDIFPYTIHYRIDIDRKLIKIIGSFSIRQKYLRRKGWLLSVNFLYSNPVLFII